MISPILANVYLHYVLDIWFEQYVRVKSKGEAYLVRYADDFVCCFEKEEDAKTFYEELKERMKKFDLELAEDKSKIIAFGSNSKDNEKFDFLGFTHINGANRYGQYKLVHKTSKKKTQAKKAAIKEWIKASVIKYKIDYLIKLLNVKLNGTFRYYGISDNYKWMENIREYAIQQLYKSLNRRSQRSKINWEKMRKILEYNPIVKPKIYHSLWQ